jgi:glyoxylase-like metal-dependent hydrolase (beta-lactamase superfamily II)
VVPVIIARFTGGPIGTNGWLVGDESAAEAMIVDAPWGMGAFAMAEAKSRGWRITSLVNTHGHWDHIGDDAILRAGTGAPLLAHRGDADLLLHPRAAGMSLPQPIFPVTPDRWLEDGEVVPVGGLSFTVLATPGHSAGGICLHAPHQQVLFSGDTLFDGAYGRTDLPGASEAAMWRSLLRLAALPHATRVYPGHGDETTIGAQAWLNRLVEDLSGGASEA